MSSTKFQPRDGFKPKLIALSVAACFSLSSTQSLANPTGGTVTSGSASFASSGNTLTITNAANTIINWQNFSIGVNEITRFLQSSGSSAVLNRVVGANGVIPQSVIDGILSSNGRVFLLNSSGIVIGATARIDVAGFVASSLNLSDQDFLNGRMRFTETPGAGAVSNAGIIDTTSGGPGGRVFLVGPDVQNSGIIRSPQGEIVLAAGKSVELVYENSPFVTVRLTADGEQALNVGQLIADSGRIGMFGALVRQGGVAEANSAVVGANGEIRLVATQDLTLDAGSRTTANGPSGGSVTLQAQGGTNLISGTVEATGSSGQGGTIQALGVRVGVIGHGVIDASGDAGGGTVLVGGDAHGANPNVQNADRTLIGPDGVIRADAGTTGDGGRVIVWADGDTRFYGSISVRGGAQGGNGGFVETSGSLGLDIQGGRVDARAPNGTWGTWLLDPTNVTIINGAAGAPNTEVITTVSAFANTAIYGGTITSGTIESNFLTVGTTQIQATNDVNFRTDLTLNYGGVIPQTFEVRAQHNIDLAADGVAHTIFTNGQNVVLSANDVGPSGAAPGLNTVSGTGSIIGGGNIIADNGVSVGGNITLSGYGVNVGILQTRGGLNRVQVGNITVTALAGGVQTGSITTRGSDGVDFDAGKLTPPTAGGTGGNVTISVAYGSVVTGNIDASGGRGGNGGLGNGLAYAGATGGNGGNVTIDGVLLGNFIVNPASIATGSITSAGGAGGNGGSGGGASVYAVAFDIGYGGNGGNGGSVSITGGDITTGAIAISAGAGGTGGSNISATVYGISNGSFDQGDVHVGYGGDGGFGGFASLSGNNVSTGAITARGGVGGAGGSGNTATSIVYGTVTSFLEASGTAEAGNGGSGGGSSSVSVLGTGVITVNGAIDTGGSAGGAGGTNNAATAGAYGTTISQFAFATANAGLGGAGGSSGQVNIQSSGNGNVTTGAITVAGGTGGAAGGSSNASAYASSFYAGSFADASAFAGTGGNSGFSTGSVFLYGGNVSAGAITAAGGVGGAGSTGDTASALGYGVTFTPSSGAGTAGLGSSGGFVDIAGIGAATGSIDTSGAGAGSVTITSTTGDIVTGSITTRSLSPAAPGGSVTLDTDTGRIIVNGNIDARGSDGLGVLVGCLDCIPTFIYGGSAGGTVALQRTGATDPAGGTAIQVNGSIFASGGNGFGPQGAAGGNGGTGGTVLASTSYGAVNVAGSIDVHAGNGGAGAAGYGGGNGGVNGVVGGLVGLFGASVSSGAINAAGGAGGAGGADTGAIGAGAGNGGNGGQGGFVELIANGNIAVGNIFAAGGRGGDGGKGNGVLAGTGGAGGTGGTVIVSSSYGSIDMTAGGFIGTAGGNGGAGGAGDPVKGGNGGAGGYGGTVDIFAPYGSIFVLSALQIDGMSISAAGPVSISTSLANGGAGGAGGADFGFGAGTPGAPGGLGTIAFLGTVEIVNPNLGLDSNAVIQGTNQLLNTNTAPSTEELEKKDKQNKQKKDAAVCK